MSLFITFEGGEGCGKSFQSRVLYKKLSSLNIPTELTHEPGGTVSGEKIRRFLKRRQQDFISPEAELFLFAACRVNLVTEVIRPGLQKFEVVICDRFADSTIAYQGYGRGLDLATIYVLNRLATQGICPILTILLDISPEEGLNRKRSRANDRFETEGLAFHNRVRDGYLKLAADEPERWLVINATLPKREISNIVWHQVSYLLSRQQDI